MGVPLDKFANRLAFERGLIRKNKGPSIVPLMIVHFSNSLVRSRANPYNVPMLLTICQRTGNIYWNSDLTKLYSMGSWSWYSWLDCVDVLRLKHATGVRKSPILQIYAQVNREPTNEDH